MFLKYVKLCNNLVNFCLVNMVHVVTTMRAAFVPQRKETK